MKVYVGYKIDASMGCIEVLKVFNTEVKAQNWMVESNKMVSTLQQYDEWGLIEGEEYNYFDKDVE